MSPPFLRYLELYYLNLISITFSFGESQQIGEKSEKFKKEPSYLDMKLKACAKEVWITWIVVVSVFYNWLGPISHDIVIHHTLQNNPGYPCTAAAG